MFGRRKDTKWTSCASVLALLTDLFGPSQSLELETLTPRMSDASLGVASAAVHFLVFFFLVFVMRIILVRFISDQLRPNRLRLSRETP